MVILILALVWKTQAPLKVSTFGWTALLGGILTIDNLWRIDEFSMCLADTKLADHLLL